MSTLPRWHDRIRTCNLPVRSRMLYPVELHIKNFRQMSAWCSGVDGSRTHVQKSYSHRKLYQHLSPILPGTSRMMFLHAGFVAKTAYWWACVTSLSLQASLRRFLSSWHPVIHPIRRVAEWTAFEEVVSQLLHSPYGLGSSHCTNGSSVYSLLIEFNDFI